MAAFVSGCFGRLRLDLVCFRRGSCRDLSMQLRVRFVRLGCRLERLVAVAELFVVEALFDVDISLLVLFVFVEVVFADNIVVTVSVNQAYHASTGYLGE